MFYVLVILMYGVDLDFVLEIVWDVLRCLYEKKKLILLKLKNFYVLM